jgi:hypothetical protein
MGFSARRVDLDLKHQRIAQFLQDAGCEGLLILKRGNLRWLTSGAQFVGLIGYDEMPALYFSNNQRWIFASNVDSQRLFDQELDQLGFQLKEWQWYMNREQYLADLCMGRRVACDTGFRDCKYVGAFLDQERKRLSPYELGCYQDLGMLLVHALEATARSISPGDSEAEIAGHLGHRLFKHGVEPMAISVSGDGRGRPYRRLSFTEANVEKSCVLQATGCKFGLYATASRSICFGEPEAITRKEFDSAVRLSGVWLATAKVNERPTVAMDAGRTLLYNGRFEHEWRLSAPGCWTGREPSEGLLTPVTSERFLPGHAVTWQARIGGAVVCDTYVCQEEQWTPITPILQWPVRRIVIQGKSYDRPDLLIHPVE